MRSSGLSRPSIPTARHVIELGQGYLRRHNSLNVYSELSEAKVLSSSALRIVDRTPAVLFISPFPTGAKRVANRRP
jgi:hypothetical protein